MWLDFMQNLFCLSSLSRTVIRKRGKNGQKLLSWFLRECKYRYLSHVSLTNLYENHCLCFQSMMNKLKEFKNLIIIYKTLAFRHPFHNLTWLVWECFLPRLRKEFIMEDFFNNFLLFVFLNDISSSPFFFCVCVYIYTHIWNNFINS